MRSEVTNTVLPAKTSAGGKKKNTKMRTMGQEKDQNKGLKIPFHHEHSDHCHPPTTPTTFSLSAGANSGLIQLRAHSDCLRWPSHAAITSRWPSESPSLRPQPKGVYSCRHSNPRGGAAKRLTAARRVFVFLA